VHKKTAHGITHHHEQYHNLLHKLIITNIPDVCQAKSGAAACRSDILGGTGLGRRLLERQKLFRYAQYHNDGNNARKKTACLKPAI